MKLNKIVTVFALTFGMVAGSVNAAEEGTTNPTNQGSGVITFTGSIIDAPCSINPESAKQEVDLGQVATAALKGSGKSTPRFFDIKLENCELSEDGANTVSITFGGPEGNAAKDLMAISGDAKGAGVAIEDMLGKRVILGKPTGAQSIIAGDNSLQLSAYLVGLGDDDAIEAGNFQAISNFTMSYE